MSSKVVSCSRMSCFFASRKSNICFGSAGKNFFTPASLISLMKPLFFREFRMS